MGRIRELWDGLRPGVAGALVWSAARLVGKTLHYRIEGKENLDEATKDGGAVLVSWHGRSFVPANYFAKQGLWAIISLSRDGEIQNRIFRRFGFQIIRGSTGRGGIRAALEAAKRVGEGGILTVTPDGPRGPTKKFGEGALLIAKKSGRPIIPVGISARPRKLIPTWDSYLIPAPFARAAIVFGKPVIVQADMCAEREAALAECLAKEIDRLEARAEELVS
jgi:lysophospholipid acyltransferase (LPLAT)-like uncharacterized protein